MKAAKKVTLTLLCVAVVVGGVLLLMYGGKPPAPGKVKVAILTWVGYGPFYVGKEKGFFEKHGLDLDIVKIEELGARHSALISGAVQFSISTYDLFGNEAPQGLPALCFVKLDDSLGGDGVVARKSIRSIKDLKGKTVAFEKGNPSHFFLVSLLEQHGLSIADIKPKYMTAGDAGAAFVAGKVDAAVTWEPWLTRANETDFGHILVTTKDKPGLIADVLLVHRQFASQRPEVVKALLRAWFDAVEYSQTHEDEANAIMAKGLGLSTDELAAMLKGIRFSDYKENRRYFGLDSSEPGPFIAVLESAQRIWLREGLIKNIVKVADVVDTSFLRDLYK